MEFTNIQQLVNQLPELLGTLSGLAERMDTLESNPPPRLLERVEALEAENASLRERVETLEAVIEESPKMPLVSKREKD